MLGGHRALEKETWRCLPGEYSGRSDLVGGSALSAPQLRNTAVGNYFFFLAINKIILRTRQKELLGELRSCYTPHQLLWMIMQLVLTTSLPPTAFSAADVSTGNMSLSRIYGQLSLWKRWLCLSSCSVVLVQKKLAAQIQIVDRVEEERPCTPACLGPYISVVAALATQMYVWHWLHTQPCPGPHNIGEPCFIAFFLLSFTDVVFFAN